MYTKDCCVIKRTLRLRRDRSKKKKLRLVLAGILVLMGARDLNGGLTRLSCVLKKIRKK